MTNLTIDEESKKNLQLMKDIIASSLSQGAVGVLIGFHLVGNNLLMSFYGTPAIAAASVVSTLQSFIVSTTFGFLSATGTRLGAAKKQKDPRKKKEEEEGIVKIALLSSASLGIASSVVFLATKPLSPMWFDIETSKYISNFFVPFAITLSPVAYLMVQTNGVVLLQLREKNKTDFLLSTTAFYRGLSLLIGYGLSKKIGFSGIGYGSAIAAWLTLLLSQFQFLKETYSVYKLNDLFNIPFVNQRVAEFKKDGWQLALQRTTEWGNLFAITAIIGHLSPDELIAIEPSIQSMVLCNLFSMGIAQGLMYESTNNRAAKEKEAPSTKKYFYLMAKDKSIFVFGNALGFVSAIVNALILYQLQNNIIHVFTGQNTEEIKLAKTILVICALSLPPDAIRQISGGVLRGWGLEEMLRSTKSNLLIMTGSGVPLGVLWGYYFNNGQYAMPLFAFRFLTIIVSACVNAMYFKNVYKKTGQGPSLLSWGSMFKPTVTELTPLINASVDVESNVDVNAGSIRASYGSGAETKL